MGDPSGCGPEITIKALLHTQVYDSCKPLVVGDAGVIAAAAKKAVKRPDVVIHPVAQVKDCLFQYGTIDVLDLRCVDLDKLKIGQVDGMSGDAAFLSVKKVIDLALAGEIDATITNPLNKEALNAAGHHFAGHTEIFAQYTGTKNYGMMLCSGALRVIHVTTHVSMCRACGMVTRDRVFSTICLAAKALELLGLKRRKIAVAGLTAHASETGHLAARRRKASSPQWNRPGAPGLTLKAPCRRTRCS
jgi:4-hydroxythreonine-4-phosphate dehydrogenase